MTLPLSRDFNSSDGGPLPHTTVNNLQDAVVNKRHGAIFRVVGPSEALPGSFASAAPTVGDQLIIVPGATWHFPCPVEVGDTILDYFLWSNPITTNTDTVNFALKRSGWVVGAGYAGAGILAPGPTASISDGTLNVHEDGATLTAAELVVARRTYSLQVDAPGGNANNMSVLGCVFQIHRV